MNKQVYFAMLLILTCPLVFSQIESGAKIKGYKGIWFELGQKSEFGDKYSGGLGTYTAKHHPLAIYSEKADKTFFVYGGTTETGKRELLAMVSYFDHKTGLVPLPTVVHQKENVNDPHDNPSLSIDEQGYLWVFVSGRGQRRSGLIYRSREPFSIDAFELIREGEFAYPQPWFITKKGFMFLFTKYTNGRELYWATSTDGISWTADNKLANGGHYQMSTCRDGRIITAFNAHPAGVDVRTNLYFLQTANMGKSWTTVDGRVVETPVNVLQNSALVRDYQSENRLVYLKDIQFDAKGNPVLFYITSTFHQPGPKGEPRFWTIAHWTGTAWKFHEIARATHNYDMGSLYIEDNLWRIIAPTEPGPQHWGTGGEMAVWTSTDKGVTWLKNRDITKDSEFNHCYARRPVNAHPDFYAFWADGHADEFSPSRLYFTNKQGNAFWQLPATMKADFATPALMTKKE
jgi:hypothetical protein